MSIKEREVVIGVNDELIVEEPYFYDLYPEELELEEEMSSSDEQTQILIHLIKVLEWLFHEEGWYVSGEMHIRQKPDSRRPVAPDMAVFPVAFTSGTRPNRFKSWKLYEKNRPAPFVVFEICSDATWYKDINEKPQQYLELGAKEYFAYDPNVPPYVSDGKKLHGWEYANNQMREMKADSRGWLWSKQLNSWVVPDGRMLRLYDIDLNLRLTEDQAEKDTAKKEASEAKSKAAESQKRENAALTKADEAERREEAARKEAVEAKQEAAEAKRREEAARAEAAAAKKEVEILRGDVADVRKELQDLKQSLHDIGINLKDK